MAQEPDLIARPDWDRYFLEIARAVAARASCRRKKVGAVLVDENHRIVGTGYNGAPRGMPDCLVHGCDVRVIDGRESCVRTLHAESNALDFAHPGATNVTLYTNVIPCRLCALRLIQVGVIRIVYEEYYESQGTKEVTALFETAGIKLEQRILADKVQAAAQQAVAYHAVHGKDATIEGCPCCFP